MKRRPRVALVLTGVVCLGIAGASLGVRAPAARADSTAGSGFESFGLSAEASSLKIVGPDPNIQTEVPETQTILQRGPIGYALASAAWPGPAGGNFGSLLNVLGFPACSQPQLQPVVKRCTIFQYPVRAEARTNTGPSTVTNDDYPGATLTAGATEEKTFADAVVGQTQASALGFGSSHSTSTTTLNGAQAAAGDATSRIDDVSLAGGVVRIGSVVSESHATTNGIAAQGTGRTFVSNASIAGVPVTIDEHGVHVQGQGADLSQATAAVNEALANIGMFIALGKPVTSSQAGTVTHSSGSAVFSWSSPARNVPEDHIRKGFDRNVITVVLGGANVSLAATPGNSLSGGITAPPVPPAPESPGVPAPQIGGSVPAPGASQAPSSNIVAAEPVALASGVAAGWIALAVIGALLIGAGIRRPTELLLQETATTCNAEENP